MNYNPSEYSQTVPSRTTVVPSDNQLEYSAGQTIRFDIEKFIGFIDPGSFFGHNELEVAYLRWFNPPFIDKNFLTKYNNLINIEKNYLDYEPVYQLYYSLLNIYLWDNSYIKDTDTLLKKIKM